MSKFHINKHGVPAPCKATKGNCPLGGDDSHFSSAEEAQAFVDEQMEKEHGLLGGTLGVPAVKDVTINHDFDEVFDDDWNERGMQVTGIYSQDLKEAFDEGPENEASWQKGYRDVYEAIKDDADRITEETGNPDFALIPEKNMKTHMREHILSHGELRSYEKPEDDWATYDKLKESAVKHFGEDIIDRNVDYEEDMDIHEEFRDELIEFGAKRMKEEAQFNINGQSVYLETSEIGTGLYETNWVDEYAEAVKNGTEKSKFKLVGEPKNVTINHDFDEVFDDDWNERGMQVTGIYSQDLKSAFDEGPENEASWQKGYRDVYEAIKDDADRITKKTGNPDFALIPEKNMKTHMREHILSRGEVRSYEKPEDNWATYDKLKESAVKHFGEDMDTHEGFRDELIEFGAKRMKKDSQFNVNGQSVYLETSEIGTGLYETNWVDEYAKAVKNGTEKSKFKVINED